MTNQENAVTTFTVNGTSYTMPFIQYCDMIDELANNPPENMAAYEATVKTYIPA